MKDPRQMTEDEYRQWRIEETRKRAKLIREGKLRSDPALPIGIKKDA